jgi:hypothetical protein
VVWTRVGGGLVSPQALALGGGKPRLYAVPSTFDTAPPRALTLLGGKVQNNTILSAIWYVMYTSWPPPLELPIEAVLHFDAADYGYVIILG